VDKPFDEGVLVWDISDPLNPKQLSHWKTGSTGAHRIGYPGGKYVNVAAAMPGYKGNILVFLDISDPKNPKEVSRWWLRGQKEGEPSIVDNSSPSPTNPGFHGPAIIDGNTAYLGYGPAIVILDISDITQPKQIGRLDMSPPFLLAGQQGVHDVLKIPGKPLLFSHSETSAENCDNRSARSRGHDRHQNPTKPRLMSMFPLPVPPGRRAYTTSATKAAASAPQYEPRVPLPDVEKQGRPDLPHLFQRRPAHLQYRGPAHAERSRLVHPAATHQANRRHAQNEARPANEDVLVDTRGNIYITDKQWGLFVLRYTAMASPRRRPSSGRSQILLHYSGVSGGGNRRI